MWRRPVLFLEGCLRNNILSEFAKYSFLNVLGMLALSCYILADTFFISKGLGTNGLAALNLSIPIYSFIHGTGLMIGMGAGTRYSIRRNQRDFKFISNIFMNALYFALIFACLFVFAGVFLSGNIAEYMGADEEVYTMTRTYLKMILLFSPAFLFNNILLCFVRNDGHPGASMFAMTVGSFANVVLDYIFIFNFGLGIFGAVFATTLAPVISIIILFIYIMLKGADFRFEKCRFEAGLLRDIFLSGFPSFITELSSGIVIIVFNIIILAISGNIGVAAYGIIANLSLVIIAVYTGIAQGIQPILGNNFGRGNFKNVRSILKYALITVFAISAIIFILMIFNSYFIVEIFNSENNGILSEIAIRGLKLYFIACPFVGFNIIISVYFTCIDHPFPSHIISLMRGLLIIIPMAIILSDMFGMSGVWLAFPVTELIVMIIALLFILKRKI